MFLVRKKKALQIVEERLQHYENVIDQYGKHILYIIEDSDLSPSERDYYKELISKRFCIPEVFTLSRNCVLADHIEEYNQTLYQHAAVFALLCEMEDDL